jgi:hypothetical protein
MKFLLFFLLTLLALPTTPVWALDNAREHDPIEFILPFTAPIGSNKGGVKGHVILYLTAPLGPTKGGITGAAVLQYTPPVGSNKGSLTESPDAQPHLSLGTATEPFAGLIEGVAECDDTGVCRADMVLSATSYQHNQTDLEFLMTGKIDFTTRAWLGLSFLLPYLEQDN